MKILCVLGNQLFGLKHLPLAPGKDTWVFLREDRELCTHFRYHKHKIIFFLAAMRKYAEELRAAGFQVHYERLGESEEVFERRLVQFALEVRAKSVELFEVEDKFFETRLFETLESAGLRGTVHESPMFLTNRATFKKLAKLPKKPFMKTFYEAQRKRLRILVEEDGSPTGGKWSFDEDNREPLPKGHRSPALPAYEPDEIDREVFSLVDREFPDHPGRSDQYWLPTDRKGAQRWARDFFERRFALFGPYEDAFSQDQPFLYHSVLTPYLNTGLVTPRECVAAALRGQQKSSVPMNSCEGFVRQVIGWREFIRGVYQNYSEVQEESNHFGHHAKLSAHWYEGDTGIPPLDDVILKVRRYGYAHHIERLMIVGSLMLLLEVHPKEAHRWFMEMFIDSSDWVMGPNVFGMALFSDGGIFATKPYICGSNYYRKMSGYPKGAWCDAVDGLYWGFVEKNKAAFARNPRMAMMVRMLEKIPAERMKLLRASADSLRSKLVVPETLPT